MSLIVGNKAPDFSAVDQHGKTHSLSDYRGQWILLYFYPKDHTPGCITEACSFRDHNEELSKHVVLLGVSGDTVDSHRSFSEKYSLPFPILADPEKKMIKDYGADNIIFAKRCSFLIRPDGTIAKIYPKVDPNIHTQEILADLDSLQKSSTHKAGP